MTALRDIPLTRVLLDIVAQRSGANWYLVERLAPLHPDFVDFSWSVAEVLTELQAAGYIAAQGDGSLPNLTLTTAGDELRTQLQPRHRRPALARIAFAQEAWADPPRGPRFTGKARFMGNERQWALRATFFTPDSLQWKHDAMIEFLDEAAPEELLVRGARLLWVDGETVVGYGEVVAAPPTALKPGVNETTPETRDCIPQPGMPLRKAG